MTAKQSDQSIKWYLEYDPGEKVKKHAPGHDPAYVTEWNVSEKQPTIEQLQQIYNDTIFTYIAEQEQKKKDAELLQAVKEKIADKFIKDNNITSIEDLEAIT